MRYYYLFLIIFIVVSFVTGVIVSIIEKSVRREFEMNLTKDKLARERERASGIRQAQHLDNYNDKVIVPIEVEECDYNVPVIVANVFEKAKDENKNNVDDGQYDVPVIIANVL